VNGFLEDIAKSLYNFSLSLQLIKHIQLTGLLKTESTLARLFQRPFFGFYRVKFEEFSQFQAVCESNVSSAFHTPEKSMVVVFMPFVSEPEHCMRLLQHPVVYYSYIGACEVCLKHEKEW